MKLLIAQILIGVSVITAAVLGYGTLQAIHLLRQAIPEETVVFGWSPWGFARWLLITLLPAGLYGCGIALHSDCISSRLGRAALLVNIVYIIAAIIGCAYVNHLVSTLHRNA